MNAINLLKNNTILFFITAFFLVGCTSENSKDDLQPLKNYVEADHLHQWNVALEAAIVNDFFTPPVAGRIYTYPNIAAYEILIQKDSTYLSLNHHYPELKIPKPSKTVFLPLSAIYAFYYSGKNLVYDNEPLETKINEYEKDLKSLEVDSSILKASKAYGEKIAEVVLDWADQDGYKETRSFPKYQLLEKEGAWQPTPPDYLDAMEPHWSTLRPFTLDSAAQFRPENPPKFDMDTGSAFYKELMVPYHALMENTEETEAIAKFWDCNPLVIKHQGHITFAEKKLTPGGHWVNIARDAMKKENYSLSRTAYTYVMLSVGIHDAFISCWDTKYHTNYIRPVTVIQERIDKEWTPILYTPNFPEYTSGHSVVSRSASTILTEIIGKDFAFVDSTEVPYGMEARKFNSFIEASDEAAISRVYGGIHYPAAVEKGKVQGEKVGEHVLNNLNLKR